MFNDNKNQISFKGIGELIIKAPKCDPHQWREWETMLSEIARLCKIENDGTPKGLKAALREKGILIGQYSPILDVKKTPRQFLTALIFDGKDKFDEDSIKGFGHVDIRGGKLEKPVQARRIDIEGGENVGVKGYDVIIRDGKSGPIEAQNDATVFSSKIDSPIKARGDVTLMESEASDIEAGKGLYVHGSKVHKAQVPNGCVWVEGMGPKGPISVLRNIAADRMHVEATGIELGGKLDIKERLNFEIIDADVMLHPDFKPNQKAKTDMAAFPSLNITNVVPSLRI